MKLLIVGAGGIGAYYAARLIQAGHAVVLVARGAHLRALQENGLTVRHEACSFTGVVTALDSDALVRDYRVNEFDAVVLTLKATATCSVLEALGSWLDRTDVPVVSLQNGVDNEALLAERLGETRVIGGLAVRIGGHIVAPGVIEAEGPAQVVVGRWPQDDSPDDRRTVLLAQLQQAFTEAGIPTQVSDHIRYELWRKLVINNGVNPLSALTGLDTRTLSHHPEFGPIVYALMQETALAAKQDRVELSRQDVDEMYQLIRSFNAIKTSMLVDREKGRPLELDSIAGAVLERCRAQGASAPFTQVVNALLKHQYQPNEA